jgi:hypothetical protein
MTVEQPDMSRAMAVNIISFLLLAVKAYLPVVLRSPDRHVDESLG